MAVKKERLDTLLVERGLAETRTKARAAIMAGEVTVNGARVDKPGTPVPVEAVLAVAAPLPYVGRGGYKLAAALDAFTVDPAGRICADVGACTGGFTDVLLQRGAARVYAIDVGQGQLDWKLRQDERVVVMERTNARYLESLPEPVSLVVIDVSFISLKLILPAVARWLEPAGDVVALIKPQFEAGPAQVGKGGIVRDPDVREGVLVDLLRWAGSHGWTAAGLIRSPIQGTDGNVEYLVRLWPGDSSFDEAELIRAVAG
jgi:23S rRNA (cytidine1920-2'-O)/16S rRNA (cytidine1409-2'-O)-methyltransferase